MPLTQLNLLCRQLQSQCAATWAGLQSALPALLQDRRTTSLELYTLLCPIAECAPMAVALSPEFEGAFHALAQSVSSVEVSPCVLMQCTRASHVPCMLVLMQMHMRIESLMAACLLPTLAVRVAAALCLSFAALSGPAGCRRRAVENI